MNSAMGENSSNQSLSNKMEVEDTFLKEYNELPESIKFVYTFVEYKSMTDLQRAGLVDAECEPEWDED